MYASIYIVEDPHYIYTLCTYPEIYNDKQIFYIDKLRIPKIRLNRSINHFTNEEKETILN